MAAKKDGILLESGTNEVEILEFLLDGQSFGVNVAKIQAIVQFDAKNLTVIPLSPPSLAGMLLFRDRTIPLLDLKNVLGIMSTSTWGMEGDGEEENRIVLVMEFNGLTSAAIIDGVNRIHRISWEDLKPLNPLLNDCTEEYTGTVTLNGRDILILDLEKIVGGLVAGGAFSETKSKVSGHPARWNAATTTSFSWRTRAPSGIRSPASSAITATPDFRSTTTAGRRFPGLRSSP